MKQLQLLAVLCCFATGCAHVQNPRADFLKLIDRPRVALAPQVEKMSGTNGIVEFHFSFAADTNDRVPGILMEPTNFPGRRPVVIALHGTGGSKNNMLALCRKLADAGFIAVAIDGRYHGERKSGKGEIDYGDAIVRAWHGSDEHPFYYDTVWDVMRLVDYLSTRDDVDANRIGLIGTIQNAFDAIAKENGVTQPDSAFVQKFYDRVVPGIAGEFDGPQMLALIAPRPLLMINSDSDIHTPLPGVQECVAAAEKIYAADNATNNFAVIIQKNTGHQVKPESERAAIEWFVKWLKP